MINLIRKLWDRDDRMPTDDYDTVRPVRGRVSRVHVIGSGETSVVMRFGVEEAERMKFRPGLGVEVRYLVERPAAKMPAKPSAHDPKPKRADEGNGATPPAAEPTKDFATARASERFAGVNNSPCNCGATQGHPHEPDCIWWGAVDRRMKRYDELIAAEYGKPVPELTAEDRASPELFAAHERVVRRMHDEDRQQ